jgi:hypothetical protein
MAKKSQKEAAARARAQRLAQIPRKQTTTPEAEWAQPCTDTPDLPMESDLESDCQYVGGVNHDYSDTSDDEDWSDSESNCSESLSELEGSELEDSLQGLQAEVSDLDALSKFEKFLMPKSAGEFKKAEKDRGLGYTGLSLRTKQRREKEARERAAFRESVKKS